MDVKLRILLELLILYSLVYFMGFLNERLIFYDIFCDIFCTTKVVWTLTAVSGLREAITDNIFV